MTSILVPACAQSQPGDELGGDSAIDGEDGKGDAAAVFTFYNLLPDNRACSLNSGPDCGTGFFVSRANRSTTQCGRGVTASQCKVQTIDWTGTAMPASVAKGYEDDLRAGKPLLVRGNVVPSADDRSLSVAVTEVWVASQPEWVDGVFTLVKDNGLRCIKAPCPSLTEQKLNSNLSAQISGVDFEASGASQDAIDLAQNAMYGGDGVVVVGYRDYDSDGGKVRTANKFFTKAPVPLF
ncbi:MAG TPA: DUF6748 domain-containing protein [Kofleriaceae bacterium]